MVTWNEKLAQLGIEPMGEKFAPFPKDEIVELERNVGAALPNHYREFVSSFGSSMFSSEINCKPKGDPLYFGSFYGYDELVEAIATFEEVLPEGIIPIGNDGGGNQFCIAVSGKNLGRVYFHNHSIGWQADADELLKRGELIPPDIRYVTVHEIAPSFEQFILGMVKED